MPSTTDFPQMLFMCFIHLTDSENDITTGEVEDFHALIAAPKWTKNAALREALVQLHSRYELFWSAYTANKLSIDFDAIGKHWGLLCQALPADEASDLRLAASEFVRNVHQSSTPLRTRQCSQQRWRPVPRRGPSSNNSSPHRSCRCPPRSLRRRKPARVRQAPSWHAASKSLRNHTMSGHSRL